MRWLVVSAVVLDEKAGTVTFEPITTIAVGVGVGVGFGVTVGDAVGVGVGVGEAVGEAVGAGDVGCDEPGTEVGGVD